MKSMVLLMCLFIAACGPKVQSDLEKSPAQVQEEVKTMSMDQIQKKIGEVKELLEDKKGYLRALASKLEQIPEFELALSEGGSIKKEFDHVKEVVQNLEAVLNVYVTAYNNMK